MQRRLTYSVRRTSGDKENKPPCHPNGMGPEKKGRGRGAEGETEGRRRGAGEKEGRGRGVGEKGRCKGQKEGEGEGLQKKKRLPLKNVPSMLVIQNRVEPSCYNVVLCVVFLRSEENYLSCWCGTEKARPAWHHDQEE